ncbi:unnamed protein product [Prunus armeniaca]|uniref:CCT domain-containing protein n=1 Tax=Prunus armeniaca TaxID=36596 RepID=A0A6J5U0V6_PRUAR|nr:unnamed protein product [Prunus armeniaca]
MEEERTRREASVLRYREKRQSRLFSKKIRYQVRKLNADKRPRLKAHLVENAYLQAEGPSADEVTVADRRWEKRAAEAETVREAYLQVTGKRQIEGALNVMHLPNRPRGPNEYAAILIPGDEVEGDAEPVNVACPRKVVPFVNCMIDSVLGGRAGLAPLARPMVAVPSVAREDGRFIFAQERYGPIDDRSFPQTAPICLLLKLNR